MYPIIVPLRYIFSIPVYSGLNPAPSSSKAAILPSVFIVPVVGVTTPVTNFNNVDLPEPFVPTIPIDSPLFIFKLIFFKA